MRLLNDIEKNQVRSTTRNLERRQISSDISLNHGSAAPEAHLRGDLLLPTSGVLEGVLGSLFGVTAITTFVGYAQQTVSVMAYTQPDINMSTKFSDP